MESLNEQDLERTKHLTRLISAEVNQSGSMGFDRFMELALYHPQWGYYENDSGALSRVGKSGDFITSVSVGDGFGKLLALHLEKRAKEFHELGHTGVVIAEAGAHHGQLAWDILEALKALGSTKLVDHYCIIETSSNRKKIQQSALGNISCSIPVNWVADIAELVGEAKGPVLFISNELFDAIPVKRLKWESGGKRWVESRVINSENPGAFTWSDTGIPFTDNGSIIEERLALEPSVKDVIPDGFSIEVSPEGRGHYESLSKTIPMGVLLTIDYGMHGNEWLQPHKPDGSLRGFSRHRHVDDVLANPGIYDLTADVCFRDLEMTGHIHGWKSLHSVTQQKFLTQTLSDHLSFLENSPGFWSENQRRHFLTLIAPQFFGTRFKILEQTRGI